MTMFTGRSTDGSDMEEVQGVYVNPKNPNEWSSTPYPEQQRIINKKQIVLDYMNGRYTLDDVYRQVKNKTCPLPRSVRGYVSSHYDNNGVFITNNQQIS